MKILYIHQYFRTPQESGSIRSYYLAKELVIKGIDVEVITGSNRLKKETKNIDGIMVHYLPVPYENHFDYKKRIWAFLRFVILAIKEARCIKSVDIYYIMTTPLTTGFIGLYQKWVRKTPFIFEIGDLWPEVPIQMNIIKNSLAKWVLYKIEQLFYQQAKGLIALSPAIESYCHKLVPDKPISVIPNISDCTLFDSNNSEKNVKKKYGINKEFVIGYIGTIGRANHLEYLIEVAKITEAMPINFLVIGDGAEKDMIVQKASNLRLKNISFHEPINKEGVKQILSICDAAFISFLNVNALNTGSPNKLFDAMAAGKLIVSNLKGWTKKLIEQNEIGICYDPDNPQEFIDKIEPFLRDRTLLTRFQTNSKNLSRKEFSLEVLSIRQYNFIKELISHS